MSYVVEYQVRLNASTEETGVFSETTTTSPDLLVCYSRFGGTVYIKLTLKKMACNQSFCAVNADLKTYIERGPNVILVASDGTVSVPMRLLKMRSQVLEAMFKHHMQERRTGQVRMEDFDTKTLNAFTKFLVAGNIENGKETVLGLIILADKYDIPGMQEAAEDYIKQNIHEMDEEEVLDTLSKVSSRTLAKSMLDSWS